MSIDPQAAQQATINALATRLAELERVVARPAAVGTYAPGLPAFPAGTVDYARWLKIPGGLVRVSFGFTASGVGAGTPAMINVPFNFLHADEYEAVGGGEWYNAASGTNRVVSAVRDNLNQRVLLVASNGVGVMFGSHLGAGDGVHVTFTYQYA